MNKHACIEALLWRREEHKDSKYKNSKERANKVGKNWR